MFQNVWSNASERGCIYLKAEQANPHYIGRVSESEPWLIVHVNCQPPSSRAWLPVRLPPFPSPTPK